MALITKPNAATVLGTGLGLRRSFLEELLAGPDAPLPDFLELAPENWMNMGGRYAHQLAHLRENFPLVCHGLSLSIGSSAPLDREFLQQIKQFLDRYDIAIYSEHLSYTSDHGQLYDLLPLPMTEEAVHHVARRVNQVQDMLGRRLVLENVSTYATPHAELSEVDFVRAVLSEADCDLLLDINNVYVNSVNHGFDALHYLRQLPAERIRYLHVAGHRVESDDLLIDTHGSDVCDPVWQLLRESYELFGVQPTLLERDFNLPPLTGLLNEMGQIRSMQHSSLRQLSHG